MKHPKWILGAGWIVFLLYAYPGYLQSSSVNQLVDARVGDFTDWGAPIMTEIWRLLGWVVSGPATMLVLQSGLLLAGCYLVARRVVSDGAAAIIASCVLVLPPTMVTTAVITPEALLPGLLLCGTAALLCSRFGVRLLGLGLVALACGMHDAAPCAALPIVVALFVWRDQDTRRWRIAIALAGWLVAVLAAWGLTWVLVDMPTETAQIHRAVRDITGTVQGARGMRDDELRPLLDGVRLASSTDLVKRARTNELLVQPESDDERDALYAARRAVTRAHPGAYLAYRGRMFLRVLGITKSLDPVYTQFLARQENSIGLQHHARHSLVQRTMIAGVRGVSHTPLVRPYLYLALALVMLPFAIVRKHRLAAVLLVSGLAYELSLFVWASRTEYRDSQWLIVATILAIALVVATRLEARHERVGE